MCAIFKCFLFWFCALVLIVESHFEDEKYVPRNFCVRLITNNSILVRWVEPVTVRAEIQGYTVYYTRDTNNYAPEWDSVTIGNYPMLTLRNINLGEDYYFRVRLNTFGLDKLGPISDVYAFKLVNRTRSCYDPKETAPSEYLRAAATSYSTVEVWWNLPYDPHEVMGFTVLYGVSELGNWYNKTSESTNVIELTNLEKYATYTIIIAATTDKGIKYYPREVKVKVTPEEVPMEVQATDITADSIILKWLPPLRLHPAKYRISYNGFKDYVDATGIRQKLWLQRIEKTVDGYITAVQLDELSPFTKYFVNISAIPIDGSYRPSVKITLKTDVGAPGSMSTPFVSTISSGGIQIYLPKASEENGPINYYYVVVVPVQKKNDDLPTDSYTTEELLENQWLDDEEVDGPYIAAKLPSNIPYAFLLGNGIEGGFKNHKLYENQTYRVFVRAVSLTPYGQLYTDSPYSDYFSLKGKRKSFR